MQLGNNRIGDGLEMNAHILQEGGLDNFIKSSDPLSYVYLEQKLRKHMASGNVEKVVSYYLLTIQKNFNEAPTSLKLCVKEVKDFLRKSLLL